jgi:signal transduction histidine kinase
VVAEQAAERERHAREDRDRLIATVSHDLATPLSVLSGTVQFMKRHGSASQADLSRLLARIETASARATALVRTLACTPAARIGAAAEGPSRRAASLNLSVGCRSRPRFFPGVVCDLGTIGS